MRTVMMSRQTKAQSLAFAHEAHRSGAAYSGCIRELNAHHSPKRFIDSTRTQTVLAQPPTRVTDHGVGYPAPDDPRPLRCW
jgi:hypothetical protein